jgi:acetoin utilization protein AcuB
VKPLDSIEHAREIMENRRVNQLPVVVDGRLVGIVTDRDLRAAFPSVFDTPLLGKTHKSDAATDPKKVAVEMVMTPNVLTATLDDSVVEAAKLMRRERIGALPIVEGGRLVGVLTRSDVLDAFVRLAERTEA